MAKKTEPQVVVIDKTLNDKYSPNFEVRRNYYMSLKWTDPDAMSDPHYVVRQLHYAAHKWENFILEKETLPRVRYEFFSFVEWTDPRAAADVDPDIRKRYYDKQGWNTPHWYSDKDVEILYTGLHTASHFTVNDELIAMLALALTGPSKRNVMPGDHTAFRLAALVPDEVLKNLLLQVELREGPHFSMIEWILKHGRSEESLRAWWMQKPSK